MVKLWMSFERTMRGRMRLAMVMVRMSGLMDGTNVDLRWGLQLPESCGNIHMLGLAF